MNTAKLLVCFVYANLGSGAIYGAEYLLKPLITSPIYCKDLTPGEARVLACLYARSDKLSGKCEYAFYNAAAQLERAVGELPYVASECADDLNQFCQSVPAGEGRLLKCIEENDPKVSSRCKKAMKQVGLK